MNIKKQLTIFVLFAICINTNAQFETLITVNPIDGSFNIVNSIPNVNYVAVYPNFTTFDQNGKRYIFKGKDFSNNTFLYSVNALTGNIVSNPSFPLNDDSPDKIIELQYDNSSNMLYGLYWNNDMQTESLISLDTSLGNYSIINSLPILDPVATAPLFSQNRFSTFDSNHSHYILKALDENQNARLFTIDAATGNILESPIFPQLIDAQDGIFELQYDNASNNLYGIYFDISEGTFYLVLVDQQTGQHSILWTIPNIYSLDTSMGYSSFNELHHNFTFRGLGENGWRLFTIDVNNGTMVSQPLFPVLNNSQDNIIELQYDNNSGVLYALHWVSNSLTTNEINKSISGVFPNPIIHHANYKLEKTYEDIEIQLINSIGQVLQNTKLHNVSEIEINRESFPCGIYYLKLLFNNNLIEIKKVIFK